MKRQAQIKNNVVQGEWQGGVGLPQSPDASWTFLDVTERPEAKVGMTYAKETDTFIPQVIVPAVDPLAVLAERVRVLEEKVAALTPPPPPPAIIVASAEITPKKRRKLSGSDPRNA